MTTFFFDCYDGPNLYADAEGLDCEGPSEIREQAIRLLLDVARDNIPDTARFRRLRIKVQDDAGACVLETRLVFTVKDRQLN